MRKIIAALVGLMMSFSVPALGEEMNLSSMVSDELIALREAINVELRERNGIADTVLHPGAYTVGKSIEAGNYTLTYRENSNEYSMPAGIGVYLDAEHYREDDAFSYTIIQVGTSMFIELIEGMVVKIDNFKLSIEKAGGISETSDASSFPVTNENVQSGSGDDEDASTPPQATSGVTPEFKTILDGYEAFFDSYIEFIKNFDSGNSTLTQLTKYSEMMTKYEELLEALYRMKEEALSTADSHYYEEVSLRIMQKLANAMSK